MVLLHAISLTVALVPGLYRWWNGRQFRRASDDPALAERWWALRTRTTFVSFVCAGVATSLNPNWMGLILPVQLLASAIGGFPARRVVFGESWSLGAYLLWCIRLAAGIWGFWIALATLPWLLPRPIAWAGPAAAVVLLVWQHWYGSLVRWSLGATRLDPAAISPELAQGFARVVERSTAPAPDLWRAGPPESMLANAVALPTIRRSSVLFSNALLEALSPAEVTAILAHEMGHIEYYTRRRLLSMSLISVALIGFATMILPGLSSGPMNLLVTLWPLLLLGVLALRTRWRQENETASDRRAVELCGDAEAVASGLTKLHALGRIPRRWSAAFEQRASHPSLARRLASIRGISPSATLEAPVTFQGVDLATWIVIEPDRVRHLSGVLAGASPELNALIAAAKATVSLPYAEIRELRVVAGTSSSALLRVVGADGRTLSLRLRPDDVVRVQSALDRVDHLVPPAVPRDATPLVVGVALSASLAAAGLAFGSPTLAGLGLLTAVVPSPAASLAAGLGATAQALATLGGLPWLGDASIAGPVVLVLAAGALLHAWRWRPLRPSPRPALLPGMLAIVTLIVWTTILLLAPNLLTLHRLAVVSAAGFVAPIALGGALWRLYPARRVLALSVWLLALVPGAIASSAFTRVIVRDPLMATMTVIPQHTATLSPIAVGPAPHNAVALRVSPDGQRFLAGIDENDEGEPSGRFIVGRIGQPGTSIAAADVQFLADDRVLVLRTTETGTTLALYSATDFDKPLWQQSLDAPETSSLSVNHASARWRVTGYTRHQLTRIDGDAGGGFHTSKWNLSGDAYQWIGGDGSSLLGLRPAGIDGWTRQLTLLYAWNLDLPMYPESLVVATGTGVHTLAESDQDVRCEQPVPDHPILCLATDGGSTRVWKFDGGQLVPLGELAGRVVPTDMTPTGELAAWRDRDRLLIDSRPLAALVLPNTRDRYEYWQEWTTAGRTVGALVSDQEDRTSIRTFGR